MNRRRFLKTSAIAFGAAAVPGAAYSARSRPAGANGDIRLAVIGINNKGANLTGQVLEAPGVRLVALCDVDPVVLAREAAKVNEQGIDVFTATDMRDIFDRRDVDGVVIATSNHWHALGTIWACQAGKDVYVEKPVSRTVWEGRKMVEAANKYGRIVQSGTQSRSDLATAELIEYIKQGHLGRIKYIHSVRYKVRPSIGLKRPWYPDWLDFDLACGPTPMLPLERNEFHYDWHWKWNTGNGDLGNLGIHNFDLTRWIAGHDAPPPRVMSLGGRFVVRDAADTPNTQLTIFDYPEIPIILENRGLPAAPGASYSDNFFGTRDGSRVQCENGYYVGFRGGWAYDNQGNRIRQFVGVGAENHVNNFVDAMRSRRTSDLTAPIEGGHLSTSSCHYGNISYRLGRKASLADVRNALGDRPASQEALEGIRKHLDVHGYDLNKPHLTLGPWLELDGLRDNITAVEGGGEQQLARARFHLKETQRPPYIIPDQV